MICFPNAKINLGLQVARRRGDGFHNLRSVFYPVPLYDVLEFKKADKIPLIVILDNIRSLNNIFSYILFFIYIFLKNF